MDKAVRIRSRGHIETISLVYLEIGVLADVKVQVLPSRPSGSGGIVDTPLINHLATFSIMLSWCE